MSDAINEIITHLEFLGYTHEKNEDSYWVEHPRHLNFVIIHYRGGFLFMVTFTGTDYAKSNRGEFLNCVNELNDAAIVARHYVNKDGNYRMEAYVSGHYDRPAFANFMDGWHSDGDRFLSNPDLGKFFD